MPIRARSRFSALLGLIITLTLALTAGGAPLAAQRAPIVSQPSPAVPGADFHSSPIMFIENVGQWPEAARFQVWGGTAGTMWLAEDAIWLTIVERTPVADSRADRLRRLDPTAFDLQPADLPPARGVNVRLSFVGANPNPRIEPFDRLDTVVSYFIGNDPDQWRPDVPVWGGVRYVDLYPGVDLEITSQGGQMVQRLSARPGADLNAVRLRVEGTRLLGMEGDDLRASTGAGESRLSVPAAEFNYYVEGMNGGKQTEGLAKRAGTDPVKSLSVEELPSSLLYSALVSAGYSTDIGVDAFGQTIIVGSTTGDDFPLVPGSYDTSYNGWTSDAFAIKLDFSGSRLLYATFLGGELFDRAEQVAVDANGNAYVVGWTTSRTFPTTSGAFDRVIGGTYDSFVAKINSTGTQLQYATYLGGSGYECYDWLYSRCAIAVDTYGSAYVTGRTSSTDFPTTSGALDRTPNGIDAYVSKLTPNGSGLVYSTYLGGSSFEYASGIAVDITGCAYVIGETGSSDFPTTIGAFNRALSGGSGVFVTKLNTSGSRMVYSTFLGHGSGRAIAVDASGNAIAIGLTNSADFPTTNGAFDTSYNGQQDIFVTRLNPYGSQLLFSTYLGGTGVESGIGLNRVTMDSSGRSVLAGTTDSADFPVTVGSFDDSYNGGRDTFISAIDPSGNALAYSTFLSKDSEAGAIVTDAVTTGVVYVTGSTGYEAFPVTPGALNLPRSGMYVLKLVMSASTSTISGRVTDANGRGIPGVTVSAGASRNTTTDANGNYTFIGLPAGTYIIRPEKAPYAFSPPSRTVTVPPNATGVDFQAVAITKIQVNQVLGNTTNYVAGKDTAVRVFMSDAVPFDPDHQQLQIYRNGNLITQTPLKPQKFSGRSNVLDFLCDRQECDAWQKGFYTFEARVNGDYLSQPSVEFKERKKLIVLVVPVRAKVGGVDTSPSDAWKTAQEFLLKVYPIAREGVSWEHGREIDATDLDLSTDEGKKELRKRLYDRRSLQCKIALGFGIICYDAILGILPKDSLCPPQQIPCSVSGQSYPDMKMAVVTDTPDLQLVIAHEVGHIIGYSSLSGSGGLGDEYDGRCGAFQCNINPPPSSYVGRNGFSGKCENPISCQFSQAKPWEGKAGMGSKVLGVGTDQDYPFDVAARHALTDSLSFMGAAGAGLHNYWVTPRAYNYLFDNLTKSAQAVLRTQAEGQVLFVSGSIGRDGNVSMEPAYHGMYVTPPITTGEYSLNIAGESGDVLVSQGFNVSFVVLSDPPQDLDEARFGVAVRLPDEARTLRIMRGTTILTEKIITPNAPTLSLTSPTAGQTWAATGNYTIRWQGNDIDGDTMYYTVLYRQGAGDWIVLGADLTANELTVNAAGLPGGTAAQVQVLATDGINTTTAGSGLFTVGRKGPEAFITYPADGASFMPGVSFFLQGTAYDLEDGTLPDSAYRWTSNRDGDLGTGATNLVILSPGPHVITLTVTDSDGNRATATVRIWAGSEQLMPLILRGR